MSQELPFLQQIRNTANVTLDVLLTNLSANIGTAYNQANLGVVIAENAYAAANNADADAINALNVATAAYNQANNGFNRGNTALLAAEAAYGQANNAYATANIGISTSGAAPGSYGSGSQIPVFTVDNRGRITTITTVSYNLFTPSGAGIVKASGGGTTNFLRADGNWAAPPVASAQTLTANGYIQLSSGLILQWGQFASSVSGESLIQTNNFYLTFPHGCLYCSMTPNGATPIYVNSTSATSMLWATSFSGGAIATSVVKYFAIGF